MVRFLLFLSEYSLALPYHPSWPLGIMTGFGDCTDSSVIEASSKFHSYL